MFSLYKKELKSFLGNTSGYIVISIFLLFCVLFLFFFETDFNILNNEIATLDSFFQLAPWALIFMIPALTMRSFAEEKQSGTIELLFTQPISKLQIIIAKYGAILTVVLLALVLTFFFIYSIEQLTYLNQTLDKGILLSSYLGLFFMSSAFIAIGIWISSLVKNSITAYLIGIFSCFFFYFGFSNIASYNILGSYDYMVNQLGFYSHYTTFTKGILSLNSLLYFICIIVLFLGSTWVTIKPSRKAIGLIVFPAVIVFLSFINLKRIDLTQDYRYTLSEITVQLVKKIQEPLHIEIYLEGDFPSDLKIFRNEVKRQLEEVQNDNALIEFNFINPYEEQGFAEKLNQQGIIPVVKRTKTDKGTQEFYIYPYGKISYKNKQWVFPLIKDMNLPVEQNIENIEFTLTKAISDVLKERKQKVGLWVHHREFEPEKHQAFYNVLNDQYDVTPFLPQAKQKLTATEAKKLNEYDALLIVDPQDAFSDTDREAIDQYIMNGGKTLWLLDGVNTEIDSLYQTGKSIVIGKDLGLTQLLFKYGVRVNPNLIRDFSQNAPISLITDEYNGKPVFTEFDWYYYPISNYSPSQHTIVENIAPVRFEFVSTIDTLNVPEIKKEVLLATSETTSVQGTLSEVNLGSVDVEPNLSEFNKKSQIMAVLLEGRFTSAFKNRVHSFDFKYKDQSSENKMIVIADGDIAKNTNTTTIGGDQSGTLYGNQDFLMNAIAYLLDDNQIFLLKNKTFDLQFLDPEKLQTSKSFWKWFNTLIPLTILWLIGLVFIKRRLMKYGR